MGLTLTRGEMLDRLIRHYDLSELRRLCFELNVPYEELPGETLSNKAISLIEWLERHERLPELLSRLQRPAAPPDPTPPPVAPPPESGALKMARRKLAILEQQAAGYTALSIPAHLQIELEEARAEVARLEGRAEVARQEVPLLAVRIQEPDTAVPLPSNVPRSSYHPLFLRLSPANAEGAYPAELSSPELPSLPGGTLVLNLAELAAADADAYGRRLGEALFGEQGALRDAYQQARAFFTAQRWKMQLQLRLEAEELEPLRWERLQHPVGTRWYPLATAADPLFSRFIPAGETDLPEPVAGRPLSLLVVIASPPDGDRRGLDAITPEERQTLHALFEALPGVEVTYLESETDHPPAWDALRAALLKGYPLLHLVCHGKRKPAGTELYLEDRPVQEDELLELFRGLAERPRLVFLAACESATRARTEAFLPLGPALVAEGGVPAVVAMADRVGLATARDFAAAFYTSLLAHGLVDRAAQEARLSVRDRMDWSVPVLFSRLPHNRLWGTVMPRPNETPGSSTLRPPDPPPAALSDLRRQLNQRFDDAELEAFCLDHFPAVYDKFGRGLRKDEKINLLLDYCRHRPEEQKRLAALLSRPSIA